MKLISKINLIKQELMLGIITYGQAKAKAQPVIDEMNRRGEEIAKRHNKRFSKFAFAGLMR